jgi:hypothetical protein
MNNTSDELNEVKDKLKGIFALYDENEASDLVGLLKEEPQWLEKFADNLAKKEKAIASGDETALNALVEEERSQVREILTS